MKIKNKLVSEEVATKVEAYINTNYKSYVGKTLTIMENDSAFFIYRHKDGGPLVLGKGILG